MFQTYSLTRTWDGMPFAQTFTVSDDDAINCAHMLAAGFNTINRNMLGDFVLAVVDTKAGTVQYDGKIEQIKRDEPWSVSQTFNFEASTDADTMVTIFDNENGRLMFPGKFKFAEESKYAHVNRDVLESAYGELEDVKSVLSDAGVETIPADAGVRDLVHLLQMRDVQIEVSTADIEQRDVEIAELVQQRANQNAAARDELIEFARGAYENLRKIDPEGKCEDLQGRYRGTIDTLAQYLVATGEADRDERHAAARRLVEKGE